MPAKKTPGKFDKRKRRNREITSHVRRMAEEAHDMTAGGDIVNRGEALAILLWERALGYTECSMDDEGVEREVKHKPEAWAISMVYERLEGRTPVSTQENDARIRTSEKVREISQDRLNKMAQKAAGASVKATKVKGPPSYKKES